MIKINYLNQYAVSLSATWGGFLLGCCLGWPGPVLLSLKEDDRLNIRDGDLKWIVSLLTLGALIGGLIGGSLIQKFGRKKVMITVAVLHAISWSIIASAQNSAMFFIGRFINGLACGMSTLCVPIYISEVTLPQIRGVLGFTFQVMVSVGVLIINAVGLIKNWRWITCTGIAGSVIWVILLIWLPESPVYYVVRNELELARTSLKRLRGHKSIEEELLDIQRYIESLGKSTQSFHHLFDWNNNLKPLLISFLCMMGQQLSGINAILAYMVTIFASSKVTSSLEPIVQSVIISSIMVLTTILAMGLIEKMGRRLLLNASGFIMAFSTGALGLFFYFQIHDLPKANTLSWLPLVSLCLFITAFSVGYGPLAFLIMAEILPPEIKGIGSSIAVAVNWTCGFLSLFLYIPITDKIGIDMTFFGYSAIMFIITVLTFMSMPETKGKSLEEIQMILRSNKTNVQQS